VVVIRNELPEKKLERGKPSHKAILVMTWLETPFLAKRGAQSDLEPSGGNVDFTKQNSLVVANRDRKCRFTGLNG
jgi:hypothetical protein